MEGVTRAYGALRASLGRRIGCLRTTDGNAAIAVKNLTSLLEAEEGDSAAAEASFFVLPW